MKSLIIMCGLPGSGKSTYVNKTLLKASGTMVVCADDVRLSMGHKFDYKAEPMVHAICKYMTRAFMERGLNVVLDECSVRPEFIQPYVGMAREYGYHTALYLMTTHPSVCKKRRIAAEPEYPWEQVIERKLTSLEENLPIIKGLVDVVYEIANQEG